MEDTSPFCGATDTAVLVFSWCLAWDLMPGWMPYFSPVWSSDAPLVQHLLTVYRGQHKHYSIAKFVEWYFKTPRLLTPTSTPRPRPYYYTTLRYSRKDRPSLSVMLFVNISTPLTHKVSYLKADKFKLFYNTVIMCISVCGVVSYHLNDTNFMIVVVMSNSGFGKVIPKSVGCAC